MADGMFWKGQTPPSSTAKRTLKGYLGEVKSKVKKGIIGVKDAIKRRLKK